jgi:hypothetical protein
MSQNLNRLGLLFPEILFVGLIALSAPFYLWHLGRSGHLAVALFGLAGWTVGVGLTSWLLWRKQFLAAYLPMALLFGVGILIHAYL